MPDLQTRVLIMQLQLQELTLLHVHLLAGVAGATSLEPTKLKHLTERLDRLIVELRKLEGQLG